MTGVLVPYDGSKLSQDALVFACERFPEAEITALFIVDTTVTHQPEQYMGVKFGEIYEQRESDTDYCNGLPVIASVGSTMTNRPPIPR